MAVWLLIAAAAGLIAFLFFIKQKLKGSAFAAIPLFSFYMSFVLTITVIGRYITSSPQYQLTVFWTYKAIQAGQIDLKAEIFWNVVLFIPIGILICMLLPRKAKWVSVFLGLLISAGIELSQLFLCRGLFEFDDIIHNTLGTIIGFVVFLIVSKIASAVLSEHR